MKKNFLFIAATAMLLAVTTSCNDQKQPATMETNVDNAFDNAADSTYYGRCNENIAMNTFEIVTDKGDTLQMVVDDFASDSIATLDPVKGGKAIGDRMAVVAHKNENGEFIVEKAINLTTLLGKWTALDKSFEIQEGGVVVSNFQEPKPYTEWKINNGQLVLSADTFDIYELGADSLLLENQKGIYAYKRQK